MTEELDTRPVVMLSGGRTTVPLARRLSRTFRVGVFDQSVVRQVLTQDLTEILCPATGVQQGLRDRAVNDAAVLTAHVVSALPNLNGRFSLNGVGDVSVQDWLPSLSMSIFQQLALDLRTLEAFHEHVPVAAVVTHEDVTPRFRALVTFAKARGVPTVHIPHANHFCRVRPDIHDVCLSDYILAASPWMRDWYVMRGYPQDRIIMTGNPVWDGWLDNIAAIPKHHARTVLRLHQDAPVVLYCTSWPQRTNAVDDHSVWPIANEAVLDAVAANGWQLIWSLHPGDPPQWKTDYANRAKEKGVPALVTQGHLAYTARAADVLVVVGPSNVIITAALADTPSVTIPLRGYGFGGEPPWKAEPTADGITAAVQRVLDGAEWDRDAFVQRYAYSDDGQATERCCSFIEGLVNG